MNVLALVPSCTIPIPPPPPPPQNVYLPSDKSKQTASMVDQLKQRWAGPAAARDAMRATALAF